MLRLSRPAIESDSGLVWPANPDGRHLSRRNHSSVSETVTLAGQR